MRYSYKTILTFESDDLSLITYQRNKIDIPAQRDILAENNIIIKVKTETTNIIDEESSD